MRYLLLACALFSFSVTIAQELNEEEQIAEIERQLAELKAQKIDKEDLDAMYQYAVQREKLEKQLGELKKRLAQRHEIKKEEIVVVQMMLHKEVAKYKAIVNSEFGKNMQQSAWQALIAKCPVWWKAEEVPSFDVDLLLLPPDKRTLTKQTGNIEYRSMRFFEAGDSAPLLNQRKYAKQFAKGTARYIYVEVYVKNLLWQTSDNPVQIVVRYFKPDGTLFGGPTLKSTILKTQNYSYLTDGWGWTTPGYWNAGQYRVDLLIGEQKIASEYFWIYDNVPAVENGPPAVDNKIDNGIPPIDGPPVTESGKTYQYDKLRFFESGEKADDKRNYKAMFNTNSTRYVYFEVTVKNLLWEIRDQQIHLSARYYKPDGSFFGEPKIDYKVPKEWNSAELWNGWGWNTPGNWEPGTYRVEVFAGSEKLSEGSFTVYQPTIEFEKLRFFEAGVKAPDQRDYKSSFAKNTTRYVYFETTFKNLQWKIKDNSVEITAKYYKPDGSLFGEPVLNYNIPQDWDSAELWKGWGWADPGNWEPGRYRVEIYVLGEKITEDHFTIYSDSTLPQNGTSSLEVLNIVFFEGGYDTPPKNQRQYKTSFSKLTTRYVYFEVRTRNLKWKAQDQAVKIIARYYKPDGNLFGEPILEYTVPKEWDYADLWKGWGWSDPGNWEPGSYRVVFTLDGKNIGEKYFSISH